MKIALAGFLLLAAAVPTHAADFSYHLMLTDDSKLNRYFDFESSVDDFMQCLRRPLWERIRSDEFELQGKRAETLAMMKTEAASADLDEPVRIVTNVDFGDYDFGKQRFALHPFTDATFFTATAPCSVSALPATIRLFFSNPGILDGLPMSTAKAKAFLDGRRSQAGSVDRRLEATVTFKVTRMKADGELVGEILKVVLTDTGPQKLGAIYPVAE